MLSVIIALLLAAPDRPLNTYEGSLCAYDAVSKTLVGAKTYYSYDDPKVWRVDPDRLTLIDKSQFVGASGKPFYINSDPVTFKGKTYVKYGLPRILSVSDLDPKPYGLKDGVPVFLERGNPAAEVIYMLSQPLGCEFQPYQVES